jgi:hypothetical protein
MRRIIGTIGATLALVAALVTTATAQELDPSLNPGTPAVVGSAYTNYVDVDHDGLGDESQDPDGGGLGGDWEDDWSEDYEAGDELDADMQADTSAASRLSAAMTLRTPSPWSAMGTPSGGEVITQSSMGDGSVRFITDSIVQQTWSWAVQILPFIE